MPRYFFEKVHDGMSTRDTVGLDLPDDEAARKHIAESLPDIAHDGIRVSDLRTFACTVRNTAGVCVYSVEMTYRGGRVGPGNW